MFKFFLCFLVLIIGLSSANPKTESTETLLQSQISVEKKSSKKIHTKEETETEAEAEAEAKGKADINCPLDCGGPSPPYPCGPEQKCAITDLDKYPNAYGFCLFQEEFDQWIDACQRGPLTNCPKVVCDEGKQHYKFMNQACCVECKDGRGKRWIEDHSPPSQDAPSPL